MSCVVVLMPQPEAVKEVKTRLTRGKLIIPEIMRPEKKKGPYWFKGDRKTIKCLVVL